MAKFKKHSPVLSVVYYASWQRSYMPSTEHILSEELSYRGREPSPVP
jgi:hypothetical protein